jgi:hypothetical protein
VHGQPRCLDLAEDELDCGEELRYRIRIGGVWQQCWRWPHWPPTIHHQSQVRRRGLAPLRNSEADRARSGGSGLTRFSKRPCLRLRDCSSCRCNRRCIVTNVTFKLMSAIVIPAKADCHSEYVSRRCISADHHISGWEPERRQSASRCHVPHSALELRVCLQLEVAQKAMRRSQNFNLSLTLGRCQ